MGFLDPGPLIVVRLRTRFAAAGLTASVGTAVDGGAIVETPQTEPAAYVVFDGYEPAQEVGSGLVQQIEQRWAVIVKQRGSTMARIVHVMQQPRFQQNLRDMLRMQRSLSMFGSQRVGVSAAAHSPT